MKVPEHITLDFETLSIRPRPGFPPEPTGFALRAPWLDAQYFAFGHPTKNNCHIDDALRQLERAWDSELPILFHNAKFDTSIAYEGLGAARLPWQRVHDTTFLAFLCDPHARSLGLKELAEDLLAWPPEERDAMGEWLWNHRKALKEEYGIALSRKNGKVINASKWTGYVPGDIAGAYALGDIARTDALFAELLPLVQDNGMMQAYDRERQLMPILQENEQTGMLVDLEALHRDIPRFERAFIHAENWLRDELGSPELNIDADKDVAQLLLSRGVVPEENWTLTDGGQLCMKKDVLLPEHFSGPNGARVASVLGYRNRLLTCLNMFMKPWEAQAVRRRGYVSTNWNQIRGEGGGTRTGRPSTSSPNFLNISKSWDDKKDGYVHPAFLDVGALPLVRSYVLPDAGCEWIDIDFSGQELRVFADFACGQLRDKYLADPALDPHQYIADNIAALTGDPSWSEKTRRVLVKNVNFGKLYGAGLPRITSLLKGDKRAAKELSELHAQAMPDIATFNAVVKDIVARGGPIRTWGGRLYYVEEPRVVKGRRMTWDYKLINYHTQGSAADITKQTIIDWYNHPKRDARFLVQVYDEICISARTDVAREQLKLLNEVMKAQRLSQVPMLTDPAWGSSWATVVPYVE